MEIWLTKLTAWLQSQALWLEEITGMKIADIVLFAGGTLMAVSLLWLGLYGNKPRYREAGRFGWCLLLAACVMIVWAWI